MRYYIEAYEADGHQVLGTLDGQNVLNCRYPARTAAVKRLIREPRERLSLYGRVREYRVITEDERVVMTIRKD